MSVSTLLYLDADGPCPQIIVLTGVRGIASVECDNVVKEGPSSIQPCVLIFLDEHPLAESMSRMAFPTIGNIKESFPSYLVTIYFFVLAYCCVI